tara:strand:+ start:4891 stop:5103 length:213 start_codon:yes stop_codon:yes gene_type:complete
MIIELLKNRAFQIIISILLGLGLASLFRQVCNDNNCIIIKSPPKGEIENKIFGFEDKCYTYTAKSSSCDA